MKDPDWVSVPYKDFWQGHLITGSLLGLAILLFLTITRFFISFSNGYMILVVIVIVATLMIETIMALIDNWRSKVHQHNQHGSWSLALTRVLMFAFGYALTSWLFLQTTTGIAICVTEALIIAIGEMLTIKTWETGMTEKEIHEANQKIIAMTKEMIEEEKAKKKR